MNKIKMTKDVDLLKARVEALEEVEVNRVDRKQHSSASHKKGYDYFTIHSTDGMFFVNTRGKRIEYCPVCGERLINS